MPFSLQLTALLTAAGWKVKIRDRVRCETPHVTIIRRLDTWRVSLRDQSFLDSIPPPREVPAALMQAIAEALPELVAAWNRMYPENPV